MWTNWYLVGLSGVSVPVFNPVTLGSIARILYWAGASSRTRLQYGYAKVLGGSRSETVSHSKDRLWSWPRGSPSCPLNPRIALFPAPPPVKPPAAFSVVFVTMTGDPDCADSTLPLFTDRS
jgi:hypothetical protein